MELDKRVNEIETELKIIKGEIKELLVDIRDMVNKNENPFYGISSLETLKIGVPEKEESANNQLFVTDDGGNGLKPTPGISESRNQTTKNNKTSLKLAMTSQEHSGQNVQKQEIQIPGPESSRKIDTFMLVELMRWVDYAVRTIGHSNLEELLTLYTLIGQLPEDTKRIIENIANLSIEEPTVEERVSMKDNIMVISQLSAILNPEDPRKSIQPLYETSPGWKEKEKKTGIVFN
ncbi:MULTISPECIES: hypothetical protein [unclassified Methanosarcina]|uniref:hypothetical protein n=1 Tax=unclassified Methanosarcina TaxID=2644672 RepID=UPI0006155DF5|nr:MULTISPECIES: hypothetical protein [unclassified Methanosarcina]AKB17897.1 hypothetical protein MSWHS_1034 [Methanosarcina sp. WWM596]AKB21235.1 hypothetical protein MSWH1_0964 [Methanosarcina sp. WH1]